MTTEAMGAAIRAISSAQSLAITCHINPDGGGAMSESVLARFDCDLSRDVDRPLFKRNNLRFNEDTYFQRVLELPGDLKQRIVRESGQVDSNTITHQSSIRKDL